MTVLCSAVAILAVAFDSSGTAPSASRTQEHFRSRFEATAADTARTCLCSSCMFCHTHKVRVSLCEASEACVAGLALSHLMLANTSVYAVSASSAGLGVLL